MANIVSQTPSVSEVRTALAEPSYSVGGLCTSPKINKWSKWKPVRHSKKGNISQSDLSFIKYGINVKSFTQLNDLITYYRNNNIEFEYQKPLGGESSPYRLGDFRGYENDAIRPYLLSDNIQPIIYKGTDGITVNLKNNETLSSGNVTISDLGLGDYQFGVVSVLSGSLTPKTTAIADGLLSTNTFKEAIINISGFSTPNTYNVYGFIAEMVGGNPIRYYALEGGKFQSFDYRAVSITVTLSASYMAGLRRVTWNLSINSTMQSPVTLENSSVRVRYGNKEPLDNIGIGESLVSLGNITVNANSTYTDSGTINNVLQDHASNNGGYVYFNNISFANANTRFDLYFN